MEKGEGTLVFGASDDLIEFRGDVYGEVGAGSDDTGTLVMFNDGTLIEVKYGKAGQAMWGVTVVAKGSLFDRIDICESDEADPYSDQVFFKPGLKWAYAAKEWELVK